MGEKSVSQAPKEICQFLPWDTDHFGVRIARANFHRLDPALLDQVLQWCRENTIDCLYFLAEAEMETIRCAEDHGFRLVDVRMTLEKRLDRAHPAAAGTDQGVLLRPAVLGDLPALERIARDSFIYSRFFSDPCFPRAACQRLYEIWIEHSVKGRSALVLVAVEPALGEHPGQPLGFLTCEINEAGQGLIGLTGVDPAQRGRGIGRRLVEQGLAWFGENGVEVVEVVTQGRNLVAQRLYQRAGFLTASVQLWYHRWFTPCRLEDQA